MRWSNSLRFSEKSFEVRFCAALSAALMPFNRNPQWFGMTQAQERMSGIDTMLRKGGRLTVFQFKAKNNEKFRLEKFQWRCLSRIAKKYPSSTFYVFPGASDAKQANAARCLLRHSWFVDANSLGSAFKSGAETATLSLNDAKNQIEKARPKLSIPARHACKVFGCFCPPSWKALVISPKPNGSTYLFLSPTGSRELDAAEPLFNTDFEEFGMPIGETAQRDGDFSRDIRPISSMNDFEEMLGDLAERDLASGLFGLFLPNALRKGRVL